MRPNFKNIDIKNAGFAATNAAEWAQACLLYTSDAADEL